MPTGQREKNLVGVAFLFVALAGAYWNFAYRPKARDLEAKQARLEALRTQNDRAKRELARGTVEELRTQLAQYERNLSLIRTLVPTSNEVPALLEQVSTAARRVGLDLAAVDPQPVVQGEQYDTYRYTIQIAGAYHDVANFLTNVGSLPRIVAPVNVQLVEAKNPGSVSKRTRREDSLVGATLQIQTYVAKRAEQPLSAGAN